ncbi:MAG: hypothetical protein NWQ13_01245 [Glaciimonas sp.]|nr:hypothetical protein [Glaciimonas sp.]
MILTSLCFVITILVAGRIIAKKTDDQNTEAVNKRPTSITIIGWLLVVTATIAIISAMNTNFLAVHESVKNENPFSFVMQYVEAYGIFLMNLICGLALLNARG